MSAFSEFGHEPNYYDFMTRKWDVEIREETGLVNLTETGMHENSLERPSATINAIMNDFPSHR